MNQQNFGSGGAMFPRQKKNPKGPDVGGDFILTGEELQYVLDQARTGSVKLEVNGWRRMGRNNSAFTSIRVNIPYELRKPAEDKGYQTPRQQGFPTGYPNQREPQRYPPRSVPVTEIDPRQQQGYPDRGQGAGFPRRGEPQRVTNPMQRPDPFPDDDLNDDIPFGM